MKFSPFLNCIALISLITLGPKAYAAATPTPNPDLVLSDQRTAAELPTKQKIPTAQEVEVRPEESDRMIALRLNKIAQSQEVFKKVHVNVVEGIVTIEGEVEEDAYAKSFSALSEKVQGVIGVIDQLKVTSIQKTGLHLAQSEVTDLVHRFFKFIPYLISCFLILFLTWLLGMGIYRFWMAVLGRRMERRPMLARHLSKIFSIPVYLIGFYLILEVGGLSGLAATLVGGTGVLGIILGLAGKNILENLLSSFMLSLRNPFRVGDEVVIGTESGIVHKIDSRCTMLLTHEGIFTQIPNSNVLAAVIRNVTAHPLNRILLPVKMDRCREVSSLFDEFRRIVEQNSDTIAADPKPDLLVTDITRKSVTVLFRFWVDSNKYNTDKTRSNVLHAIHHFLTQKAAEDEEDKELPPDALKMKAKISAEQDNIQQGILENASAPSEKDILKEREKDIRLPDVNH
jgi:small conductance mechanosensitive channel